MKKIHYYIAALTVAFTAIGCSDDTDTDKHPANTGDEVLFGAALPGTRTVYGDETESGFPIYWVQDDKVKVASPQCNIKTAEYQVSVSSETQNYATTMAKTGAAGIQWGTSETADFYSVYPSDGAELHIQNNNVTATLHVNPTQYAKSADKTVDGKTYIYAQPAEMGNVVMYAKTANVAKSAEPVNLHYKPFSTVIEFEITAPAQSSADKQQDITIQSLTLTAPTGTNIAGDFTFNFPESDTGDPTIAAAAGGSNAITLHFLEDDQYKIKLSTTKNMMKAKMCLMPISGVSSLSGWQVAINTSAGTFSKLLSNAETGELKPGLVHKVILPPLSYSSAEWVYNLNNWITSLPDYKNIYLSEVSLPGAWYAGSSEAYQATTDFTTLWNAGVRAFAVECRSWTEYSLTGMSTKEPTRICLSGTGRNRSDAYTDPIVGDATMISTIISNIAAAINSNEYAVLVLSYADGGSGGHRALDYNYFISGIANEITQSGATNIHTGEITANTTINDVLGKLIIKVNVDKNIPKDTYNNDMNALLSYNPFVQQIKSEGGSFNKPYLSNLYWKNWDDSYRVSYTDYSTMQGGLTWCFSSANRTQLDTGTDTDIPHYEDRQTALQAMGTMSNDIYNASTHNVWFYFNAGGTEATSIDSDNPSPTAFAAVMNPWLLARINEKVNAGLPSPLGLVMFNQCTGPNATYYGEDIIKAIVEMNSKFYLKHAGDDSTPSESEVQSAAPGYSSGMIDNNINAFGWTQTN